MKKIWNFIKDEDGLELTEYAVIGAMIVLAIIVAITALSTQIGNAFQALADLIAANAPGA
jgi:pilus assembly protein Flp/PilA